MYHGRFFPMSQMKNEALETSPSVPQREMKRWRHPPVFPSEKGSVGDIPRRSPERKEALETSPSVPQRERKRWRIPLSLMAGEGTACVIILSKMKSSNVITIHFCGKRIGYNRFFL
jgi:hypothetical protein